MFHNIIDGIYRLIYRLAYPIAERWWRIRKNNDGVVIAVWVDDQVLAVRHSYKRGTYMPGGGLARHEHPRFAAARELQEETGVAIHPGKFRLVCSFESTHGHIHLYEIRMEAVPELSVDQREIIEAMFLPPELLDPFDPHVTAYFAEYRAAFQPLGKSISYV